MPSRSKPEESSARPAVDPQGAGRALHAAAQASALRDGLDQGLQALGMPLGPAARQQLMDYLALLQKWNAVYNLTAVRDPMSMLRLHLLDSLAAWPAVRHHLQLPDAPSDARPRRVADVGSGAGLPGLVWAIAEGTPSSRFTLIDAVEKKTAFQRQAVAQLGLGTVVDCIHARVEDARLDAIFDVVASRAFASLRDFVILTAGLLAPKGKWAALKGAVPHEEIAALPQWATVEEIVPLEVPTLDGAARCVVIMRRCPDPDPDRAEG